MRIGIDFGTCNSVAAVWSEGEKRARIVEIDGSVQATCIAINRNHPDELVFGRAARDYRNSPDYLFYDRFKMLLNVRERSRWASFGWPVDSAAMTPAEVSKIYLGELLAHCLRWDNRSKNDLAAVEQLVLSVPAIWTQEVRDNYGREELQRIAIELLSGKPLAELTPREQTSFKRSRIRIVSEPTAACCYFAHCFRTQNPGKKFDGHALVCDYGGGTLDLSLCRVEDDQVTVLDSRGFGHVEGEIFGAAGVAYDEEFLRIYHGIEPGAVRRDDNWERWLRSFEVFKTTHIAPGHPNEKIVKRYLSNPGRVKETLRGAEWAESPIAPSHLVKAFDAVIEPKFQKSVSEMLHLLVEKGVLREKKHGGRTAFEGSRETFRVLFVGGFSSFMLVQAAMTRYLGYSVDSVDDLCAGMLDSVYPTSDRKPSVALGAALLAAQKVSYQESCPLDLGVILYPDEYCTLIDSGSTIDSSRNTPVKTIKVNAGGSADHAKITLWMKNNRGIVTPMPLELTCAEVFSHLDEPDNLWELGFLVGEGLVISLWVRDNNHREQRVIQLGDLISEFSGIVIQPDAPTRTKTMGGDDPC